MSSPIFSSNSDDLSVRYTGRKDDKRIEPSRAPEKDFKKYLDDDRRRKENEKRNPASGFAVGKEEAKKAAQKENEPLYEWDESSDSETDSRPSVLQRKGDAEPNEDAFAKNFFSEEDLNKNTSDATLSKKPSQSLHPETDDISSLLMKRHESAEKSARSSPTLFDLAAPQKPLKQTESNNPSSEAAKKLETPYQSSFASAFTHKKENRSASEQTLVAKEGQAVSIPVEEPSAKKSKTGIEAAAEFRQAQGAKNREDGADRVAEQKIPEKKSRFSEEGDKNSAATLAAQSITAGDQPRSGPLSATSAPTPAYQDPQVKELIEKIMDNLYTVSVGNETDTSFEIRDPNSVFNGARVILSVNEKAPDQFNVTIERLSTLAKNLVEMHGHQQALRSAFEQKGLTLHTIYATTGTLRDEVPGLSKSDQSSRDQKGDEENREDGRQKRERHS